MALDCYVDFHRLYFIGNYLKSSSLTRVLRKSGETLLMIGDDLGLGVR